MPPAEANAEAPSSEDRVATVAVADEPAEVNEPEQAPTIEAITQPDGGDTDGTAGIAPITVSDPPTAEAAAPALAAEAPLMEPEAPAAEPEAPAAEPDEPDAPAAEVEAPAAEVASEDGPDPAAASVAEAAPEASAVAPEAPPAPAPVPARPTGPEPTTMEELLAEQDTEIKSFKHGDVVEGTVVRIDKDEILVDIGAKS